jgi:hypothetical protein
VRHALRGSLSSVTAAIDAPIDAPIDRRSGSTSTPPDALSFVSSLVDLRSAVELARVLEAGAAPFEDHPPSATALAAVERALATIDSVERTIDEISFRALPRATSLTPASLLGTLRGTGVLESTSAIDRAVRSLWGPFSTFVVHQATRAHADVDDAVALARASLAASSPRAQRLLALQEVLDRMLNLRRATLLDRPIVRLATSFGEDLATALTLVGDLPSEQAIAPWLATDGLFARHLDLAERLLRAMVQHHVRPARALLTACIAPVIHNSSRD